MIVNTRIKNVQCHTCKPNLDYFNNTSYLNQ